MLDFDVNIDRKHTNSEKWDSIEETYHEQNLLPMWVADMDFESPEFVRKDLQEFLATGVLGYVQEPDSLYQAIIDWQARHHQFQIRKEDIIFSSGVVPSIVNAIQAYTKENETVMIHDPVYFPFTGSVRDNRRTLVRSRLKEVNGHFEMDFADMEEKIRRENVKLFVLCNPHNPGGRVWSADELRQLGELCEKYQVLIVSDEIHQDLVFTPNQFTTFQNAYDPEGKFSIILTAATKTFNLAGIKNSMVFIRNPKLREAFISKQRQNHTQEINTFGLLGTESAYNKGDKWLSALLDYCWGNVLFTEKYLKEKLPKISVMQPEGTYLMWLDFSAYGLTDQELEDRLIHKGKVVLNTGISFGPAGAGRMRLNIAAPRNLIEEGLKRISAALEGI